MAKRRDSSPFENAQQRFIGVKPTEKVHRESLARMEALFKTQFKNAIAAHKLNAQMRRSAYEQLASSLDKRTLERTIGLSREAHQKNMARKPQTPIVQSVKPRIFTGSMHYTMTPPFWSPWTWKATDGDVSDCEVAANEVAGTMSFGMCTGNDGGSASARAAVGTYIRPMVDLGVLTITVNPAFDFNWDSASSFGSAQSDAFIGIYVGAYTLSGVKFWTPVQSQFSLWNYHASWIEHGSDSGTNSGYPLTASTLVGSNSIFEIWVWCGGNVYGDGSGWFYYGSACGGLNVRVPAINLDLVG